ncbi:MAG: hypothetical protein L0Y66_07605 [Myxococcaceae bacterium]|nr:hypothetical protein [Myxococcaceae bacterium]MCI0670871.1 hypothetical protein [Myxococcaceae bacterium]
MRTLHVLALCLPLSLVTLTGCKSSCRALSEKLCECKPTTGEREACLRAVAQNEAAAPPLTVDDEATCTAKLETCVCENLDTPDGKEACGLARE